MSDSERPGPRDFLPPDARRERLGRVVCGCELREAPGTGGRRHHHYRAVLRDFVGNLWECEHEHADRDAAQECARAEYARRVELEGGDSGA